MTETPEERARRLGLTPAADALESPEARAQRLGLDIASPQVSSEDGPGIGSKILGTIAATGRDIPGVEAAQAGIRSLIRRQPYREALADIRMAEDAAPAVARNAARLGGGGLAAVAIPLPGGAALRGAQYGALSGALTSNPDADATSRALRAATEAGIGYAGGRVVGKIGDKVGPAVGRARDAAVTRFGLRAPARPTLRLGEASPPKAEGFIGNTIDNLEEAIKARAQRPSLADLYNAEAQAVDATRRPLSEALAHKPRHRTKAQFEWFADQYAKRRP